MKQKDVLTCTACGKQKHAHTIEDGFMMQTLQRLSFEGDPPVLYVIGHWPKDLFAHHHGFKEEEIQLGWADHTDGEVCPSIYYHDVPALPPPLGVIPIMYVNEPKEEGE